MADSTFDLVIRGGTVVDGRGGKPFEADVAIRHGIIAEVGQGLSRGEEEIDAKGRIVTPGRVLPRASHRPGRSADASIYRLLPQAIVRPRDLGELRDRKSVV